MRKNTTETGNEQEPLLMIVRAVDIEPRYLPLALDVQARKLFFDHYILAGQINGLEAWDFLRPYHQSDKAPVHLQLTIDAASLAYLSHQLGSETARLIALERYTAALGLYIIQSSFKLGFRLIHNIDFSSESFDSSN
ncbi:hypothetical protein OCU04_012647 [Sclerotinia nivalis]|uniref:Uncharacterized protein n=1 Tax=Sclerotinia nivalis TaxID=352851 RepID=A0A9X0DD61_9HELO|nr:hypothetical protein OCU04_012647 [Sclerotinia nivalis]